MKNQKGFTLIELMIGMTIALIVISGAGNLFIKTLQTNTTNLIVQKADQTLRTLSDVMTSEIRRAGYTNSATDDPALVANAAGASCFVFEHYVPNDANKHYYGYRLQSGVVYMRNDVNTATCGSPVTSGWTAITTGSNLYFTKLTFTGFPTVTIYGEALVANAKTSTGADVTRKINSIVTIRNV